MHRDEIHRRSGVRIRRSHRSHSATTILHQEPHPFSSTGIQNPILSLYGSVLHDASDDHRRLLGRPCSPQHQYETGYGTLSVLDDVVDQSGRHHIEWHCHALQNRQTLFLPSCNDGTAAVRDLAVLGTIGSLFVHSGVQQSQTESQQPVCLLLQPDREDPHEAH